MKNIRLGIKTCLMYLARLFKVILYNIFYYLDFNILKHLKIIYSCTMLKRCQNANFLTFEVAKFLFRENKP
jgi:hypothetical protein